MADSEETFEGPSPLQEGLTCPVCKCIYRDPVLLPCTHSFCQECLRKTHGDACPLCRTPCVKDQAISNRALGEACESFLKQQFPVHSAPGGGSNEPTCNLHLKPLELYCEKDEEPLCVDCVCLHSSHRLLALKEGVHKCKNELNFKLQIFEKKKETYRKNLMKFSDTMEYIKCQAKDAEGQIKGEFARIREFLDKEESLRLQNLANEEEQKTASLRELMEKTSKDLVTLDELIHTIKQEIDNTDLNILRNFSSVKRKAQWKTKEPRLNNNCLINVGQHVGALGFKIWKSMQSHVKYYPVVLNPNSASPWLSLNNTLTSMKESSERMVTPENPERFDPCVFVLGVEGYTSGRHKWDVIVSDSPKWLLGICKESVARKKTFTIAPNRGMWAISLSKGVYRALLSERQELQVQQRPEKIRVKLDMDKGEVSFYDGETMTHLVTFTHKFGERIFPIFGPGLHTTPMFLAPGKMVLHTS